MVDLSGGGHEGPIEHGFSNYVFIIPGFLFFTLAGYFGYKLYKALVDKDRRREEKRQKKQLKKKK